MRLFRHLSVCVALIAAPAALNAAGQTGQIRYTATYDVSVRGTRAGFETLTLTQNGGGWLISATGKLGPPFDLTTSKFEMAYATDWQPQSLSIEGVVRGQSLAMEAKFGLTTASIEMTQGAQRGSVVQPITPRTVVLPSGFYAGFEALAARLASGQVGSRYPVFLAPDREISATITAIASQRLATPTGSVEMRQFDVAFANPGGTLAAEIWLDSANHLARLMIPSQGLAVVRDDLSSAPGRLERIRNAGDQEVFIPALGFNLAGTITMPKATADKMPAVILVGGPGPQDRDEAQSGIPIFGQLAGALAAEGYVVVRYDKRGIGLSGGRTESATVSSYVDDVLGVVTWLQRRNDIDRDRIAIVAHGEGGALALLAAGREKKIGALALVNAPGIAGREFTLEQQETELAKLSLSGTDRAAKIELQRQIVNAAATGIGWERLPAEIRRQADTPWFKSWMLFDPAAAMKKVTQPILIVHAALDRQVPVVNADRLEALARARPKRPESFTKKTIVAGANHLLLPALTGATEEYATLPDKQLSREAVDALVTWLDTTLPAKKR